MKFLYEYRTRENEIRRGEISASDRDSAYAALRTQGIRASRVTEAPGFLNSLFGKGKRWLLIVALAFAFAVLGYYFIGARKDLAHTRNDLAEATKIKPSQPRHQIYGDPAIVAKFSTYKGLLSVLGNRGDALLACYAQPGKIVPGKESGAENRLHDAGAALRAALTDGQSLSSDDSRELRELKQIVNWMRDELRAYVENPEDGRAFDVKLAAYYAALERRSREEIEILTVTRRDFADSDEETRERINMKLRRLGLPTIVADEQ